MNTYIWKGAYVKLTAREYDDSDFVRVSEQIETYIDNDTIQDFISFFNPSNKIIIMIEPINEKE